MNDALTRLTSAGDGLVTRADLARLGVGDPQLRRALRAGELVRLARGVYTGPERMTTPQVRHLLRARAELSVCGGDVVLSHTTALVHHGLPTFRTPPDVVHLARPAPAARWRTETTVMHELPGLATLHTPGKVVSPAVAIVQVGVLSGARSALAAADAALRADRVTRDDFSAALESYRHSPGLATVRFALSIADPGSESPGESALRYDLTVLGFAVDVQPHLVVNGGHVRPDLRIRGTRVLVEFDGTAKYDDPTELRRERSREAALRDLGWELVRFQWPDLGDLPLVHRRISRAIERSGRRSSSIR